MTTDNTILGVNADTLAEAARRARTRWPDWGNYKPEQAAKYARASEAFTQLADVHAATSPHAAQMCATLSSHCRAVADALEKHPNAHPRDLGLLCELLHQADIDIRDAAVNDPSATHPGPWRHRAETTYHRAVHIAEQIASSTRSIDQTNDAANAIAEIRLASRSQSLAQAAAMVREAVRKAEHPSQRGDELLRIADALQRHATDLDPHGMLRP